MSDKEQEAGRIKAGTEGLINGFEGIPYSKPEDWTGEVTGALAAADAYDKAHGIQRVNITEVQELLEEIEVCAADDEPRYAKGKISAKATAERLRAALNLPAT